MNVVDVGFDSADFDTSNSDEDDVEDDNDGDDVISAIGADSILVNL